MPYDPADPATGDGPITPADMRQAAAYDNLADRERVARRRLAAAYAEDRDLDNGAPPTDAPLRVAGSDVVKVTGTLTLHLADGRTATLDVPGLAVNPATDANTRFYGRMVRPEERTGALFSRPLVSSATYLDLRMIATAARDANGVLFVLTEPTDTAQEARP